MKSLAEKKPFHVVSSILEVFFCLMYCSSSMLRPVCIEVNDSTLPKAVEWSQALALHQRAVEAQQSPQQGWESISAARLTGGHTAAESLWGWRDLWSQRQLCSWSNYCHTSKWMWGRGFQPEACKQASSANWEQRKRRAEKLISVKSVLQPVNSNTLSSYAHECVTGVLANFILPVGKWVADTE